MRAPFVQARPSIWIRNCTHVHVDGFCTRFVRTRGDVGRTRIWPDAFTACPLTAEAAHEIAVDAYIYFYPLLTMDVTRKQCTNIEAGKELGKGPMNLFANAAVYPPADFKAVVRPNFDTLYSIAWLDLTKEPVVVSAPSTNGRFYLLPMLDMWSDVFASPGSRTTGTEAGSFLIARPGWKGEVPVGSRASTRRRRTSGSSAAPRPTARPTTRRCTRSRRGTR